MSVFKIVSAMAKRFGVPELGLVVLMILAQVNVVRLGALAYAVVLWEWPSLLVAAYFSVAAALRMQDIAREVRSTVPSVDAQREFLHRLVPYLAIWAVLWIAYFLLPALRPMYSPAGYRMRGFTPQMMYPVAGALWSIGLGIVLVPRIRSRIGLAAALLILTPLAVYASLWPAFWICQPVIGVLREFGWFQGYMGDVFGAIYLLAIFMLLLSAAAVWAAYCSVRYLRAFALTTEHPHREGQTHKFEWAWLGLFVVILLRPFYTYSTARIAVGNAQLVASGVLNEETGNAFIRLASHVNGRKRAVKIALGHGHESPKIVSVVSQAGTEYQAACDDARKKGRLPQVAPTIADATNGLRYSLQNHGDAARIVVSRFSKDRYSPVASFPLPAGASSRRSPGVVLIDNSRSYLYVGSAGLDGRPYVLHKIKIPADCPESPLKTVHSVEIPIAAPSFGVLDTEHGFAYLYSWVQNKVLKVVLGDGEDPPPRVVVAPFPEKVGPAEWAMIDSQRGYVYFISREVMAKYATGGADGPLRLVAELRLRT